MQTETEGREAEELRPQEAARYLGMGITYVYAVLSRTRGPRKQQDQEPRRRDPGNHLNKPAQTVIASRLFFVRISSKSGMLGTRGGAEPATSGRLPSRPCGRG